MAWIEGLPSKEGTRRLRKEERAKNPKPRGRPLGWRKNKGETEPRTTIQVFTLFKEYLDMEQRKGEIIAEVVQRLFKEKGSKIIELENRLKESQSEIERLKSPM